MAHAYAVVTRRLLLLLFVLGCAVSMAASGRLVPRLIIDGAVSLAFVPIIEIAVFLALYRLRHPALPRRPAADRFLATNLPWLVWLVGVGALAAIAQPSQTNQWLSPIVWSAAVPILWSFVLEVRHYREDVGASGREAIAAALLFRAIAWPVGCDYAAGWAAWTEYSPAFIASVVR